MEKPIKPYHVTPVEKIKSFAASGEKEAIVWVNQQEELFLLDEQGQTNRLTCL